MKSVSVAVTLLALIAMSATAMATTELVRNGDFGTVTTWAVLPVDNAPPWTGASSTLLSYDVVNTDLHVWFATNNSGTPGGNTKQCAFQPFVYGSFTDSTHYTLSADLRGWTGDGVGEWSTAEIRVFALDSGLGAGWNYFPATISYTATTAADIANFYRVTAEFNVPAGFNVGSQQGIALWGLSNAAAGWAWDNVSLTANPLAQPAVPEPLTFLGVLVGLGGLGRYVRRRIAA